MTPRLERRLAAVVVTDMVGFTALLETDELAGRKQRDLYVEVVRRFHTQFGGTVVKNLGDGTMSTFRSVLDAVGAAIQIQRELVAHEVSIRIGIHVGEVIVQDGDIVGEAVNIASRIESFSVPGGVLLSDAAFDQLRNRPDVEVISMGRFRLKNVRRPFELFAVAAEGIVVPEAGSLVGKGEAYSSVPSNLPIPATPLLGRDAVLKELGALARANRLVTITGPGGVGKTRLAIELGRRLMSDHPDGVAFATMADVARVEDFLPTLASALDVKEAGERSFGDGIVALIADRRVALVLDNLENVVGAATDVAALLAQCPALRVIAMSRSPLRLAAEQEFPLATLDLPPDSDGDVPGLLAHSAIALFVGRAQAVNPEFELTAQKAASVVGICRRLDGLPRALELAAPRLRLLSPQSLYERLAHTLDALATGSRDSPVRQQTLRATIGWSHDLLADTEQRLFRRMAVFVGGCSLDDLEAVCAEPGEDALASSHRSSTSHWFKPTVCATDSPCSRRSQISQASSSSMRERTPASRCAMPAGTRHSRGRFETG